MRDYNLYKYMRMAVVLVPECHPHREEWRGFVERMRELLTE